MKKCKPPSLTAKDFSGRGMNFSVLAAEVKTSDFESLTPFERAVLEALDKIRGAIESLK